MAAYALRWYSGHFSRCTLSLVNQLKHAMGVATGSFYPPVSFYFQLQFTDTPSKLDNAFQEASGLDVEWELEEIREGGRNMYAHRLPKVVKYKNLVLQRGFVSGGSDLATWCAATLATDFSLPIELRNVVLSLLNEAGTPVAAWSFLDAWPVKWSLDKFNSTTNALAIETLEFAFSNFQRV